MARDSNSTSSGWVGSGGDALYYPPNDGLSGGYSPDDDYAELTGPDLSLPRQPAPFGQFLPSLFAAQARLPKHPPGPYVRSLLEATPIAWQAPPGGYLSAFGAAPSLPATAAPPAGKTGHGLAWNTTAGINEALHGAWGAPVDVPVWAINQGISGVNWASGADIPPIPINVARSTARTLDRVGVVDPARIEAATPEEKIARGVGNGIGSSVAPELLLRSLAAAGAKLAPIWEAILGGSNSPGETLRNAAIGGTAGGAGKLAHEITPHPFKPVAEVAGNVLGGGAATAITRAPQLAAEGVRSIGELATRFGNDGRLANGMVRAAAPEVGSIAAPAFSSRNAGIFDLPDVPPRPFEMDYPYGAPAGRLAHDMEGRPLTAEYVVGRQVAGGEDVPLPPSLYDYIVERAIGEAPKPASVRYLGRGTDGTYDILPGGMTKDIYYLRNLPANRKQKVIAHEMGHMFNDLAGEFSHFKNEIPVKSLPSEGLLPELQRVYGLQNRDGHNAGPPLTPADFGYDPVDFEHEYWAESFRAYLRNPNAFKEVAPNVAAVIRKWVNEHPVLARFIQFNMLAGGILTMPAAPSDAEAGWGEPPASR